MDKDEAKQIISAAYHEVLNKIDTSLHLDADYLMDFVQTTARNILLDREKSNKETDAFKNPQLLMDSEYQELARLSINSYSKYNENINVISKNQNEIINSIKQDEYNVLERFKTIQSHLNKEVDEANNTIMNLIAKVEALEVQSSIDALTKVYNRYALHQYIAQMLLNAHTHCDETFLIMIDLDDFKRTNDTFGHLAGDKVLIFLANLLKHTLRDNDRIFRFGGEEFVLVLTRIKAYEAQCVAERILELIRKNKILYQDKKINMTVSIGLTQMKPDDTFESLIERADQAMYSAKKSGKAQLKVDF